TRSSGSGMQPRRRLGVSRASTWARSMPWPGARTATRSSPAALVTRHASGTSGRRSGRFGRASFCRAIPGTWFAVPGARTARRAPYVEVQLLGADDRAVGDAELFVNGRPLPPEAARPIEVGSRGELSYGPPTPDGSRPIFVGAKPIVVGSRPILMGAKSVSTKH